MELKYLHTVKKDALYLKIFNQYLTEKKISLESQIEVWSIESIKRSVMSNLGVAYLPRYTVEDEINSGLLMEIPTDISKPEMTAIYAYNKNKGVSPASELFLQIMTEYFR